MHSQLSRFLVCQILAHITLPWLLTPWSWTFVVPRASCVQSLYKIWAKSNNPRQSYWRYRTFSPSNFRGGGWGTFSRRYQECVDETSSNLEWTQSNHCHVKCLFQSWDILLRFKTRTTRRQVVSKLEFEFHTKWGTVGNFGYDACLPLAILVTRVGHTMNNLSPLISIFHHPC